MATSNKKTDIVGLCAFVAVILAGFVGILNALANKLDWNIPGMNIFMFIKDCLILLALLIAGWRHLQSAHYKNQTLWTVLFIVFWVLAIVGAILII